MVRIRVLRQAHDLTIRELADRVGAHGATVSPAGLSNVENGHKRASERLLTAWAKALGVNTLDIWQEAGWPANPWVR